jgi:hypothetical protein
MAGWTTGDEAMKKLVKESRKLVLGRESIRLLENPRSLRLARGLTGEDCSANFTNCHTTITR